MAMNEGLSPADRRARILTGSLTPLALVVLFMAERIVGEGAESHLVWRLVAGALFVGALGLRASRFVKAEGAAKQVEARLLLAAVGVVLAVGLYALSGDAGLEAMGFEGSARERMAGVLAALWPALLLISGLALLFMELAYRSMPIAAAVELKRVSAAAQAGLTLAFSFVFVASVNFAASERDMKRDLSYFRTTRPSESSVRRVSALDEPVEVVLFYPPVNEVLEQLRPFFDDLDRASEHFTLTVRDHALSPELARRHQVRGNGFVVMLRGEGDGQQAESFEVGTELEPARSRLRTLDGRFQERFARLTTRPRELHLTSGHRERSPGGAAGDPPGQRLGELGAALTRSNIERRDLGLAQGLADRVPESTRAVAVIGPREAFLPEEAESLLRYVRGGGRLLVLVDPDVDHGLDPLLRGLGVRMRDGVLHSERQILRRRPLPAARSNIYTNEYSAHPTVTLANRFRREVATIFEGAGALESHDGDDATPGVNVVFPIRTPASGFWLDRDGDHERGEGEPADERFHLMAAITVPQESGEEGRAVVIADGDLIVDDWIGNRGNAFVLMDSLQWLVGEEEVFGPTQTEEDVRIQHTRDEDKIWFYGTSFGAPLPLLLVGILVGVAFRNRRRVSERIPVKRPREDPPPPDAAETESEPSDEAAAEKESPQAEGEPDREDVDAEDGEGSEPEDSDDAKAEGSDDAGDGDDDESDDSDDAEDPEDGDDESPDAEERK